MAFTLQASSALLIYTFAITLPLSLGESEGYSINQFSYTENGECVKVVSVKGNGVSDTFNISCSNNDMNVITSDGYMVAGDPLKNNFTLYSDASNTLVVVDNGKCTKKTYTTTGSSTTSVSEAMSDDDCSTIKNKMTELVKKNEKYWLDWSKNFTEHMAQIFPPGFPFQIGYDSDSSKSSTQTGTKDSSTPWWNKLWG